MADILFVGSDPALRALHERVVVGMGHDCQVAADGAEGQRMLTARPFDLIIAHERMRPIDGLSWLRSMRAGLASDTPCILEGNSSLAPMAAQVGIRDVITLPVDVLDIRAAVARALMRPIAQMAPERSDHRFQILCEEAAHVAWGARLHTADVLLERMEEGGLAHAAARGRRLAGSVAAVARALGLSREEIEDVQIGSMLHDVGLLLEPVVPGQGRLPLPAAAWELQRRHPLKGAALLRSIPLLAAAAPLVEHHHERHDGLGYPLGRAGSEIPTSARIFSVVEAFDDLLHADGGQPPMGVEEALEAVESGAGQRFDPDVTAALAPALPDLLRARLRQVRGA